MSRIDTKMPAPNGVAASSTSTFKLPIGRRYHGLQLIGSGTAFVPADLTEIRVLVNEKVIQRFSGDDRDAMNQFFGRDAASIDAGSFILVIPFDRYGMLTKDAEEATALNTGSVDPSNGKSISSLSLEVDIGAGATGTLSLTLYATQSERLDGGAGLVPYIQKVSTDFTSADNYDIPDMPRGGTSNLVVEADNYKLYERTNALNERLQRDGIRVPQAGWVVIDRTEHGYGGDPFDLRGLSDFRLKFTTSGALTLKRYGHFLGGLAD